MGIIDSGILGPFRKKIGPAIGRRHMGQNLILPLYHKTTKPPTENQIDKQDKFGMLNGLLNKMKRFVEPGFKAYARKKSARNAAYSYNYAHAFVEVEGQTMINFPMLVLSRGNVAKPDGLKVDRQGNQLNFTWQSQRQSASCLFTDLASFLVYNPVKKRVTLRSRIVSRYEGIFSMVLTDNTAGDELHCYLSFSTADGKAVGNSKYIGAPALE
ncbi:MAG: DUF6266 family protein [Bacteroidota bacterium]